MVVGIFMQTNRPCVLATFSVQLFVVYLFFPPEGDDTATVSRDRTGYEGSR